MRSAPPREYLPATDELYIAHEFGKLTQSIDNLADRLGAVEQGLSELRQMADQVRAGWRVAKWVAGPLLVGLVGLLLYLLNAKWESAIEALKAAGG